MQLCVHTRYLGACDGGLGCVQDPEQFEADGGWNFLDMEGDSDEEEEESEEGDPEFQGDSDEEGASSEEYRLASVCCFSAYQDVGSQLVRGEDMKAVAAACSKAVLNVSCSDITCGSDVHTCAHSLSPADLLKKRCQDFHCFVHSFVLSHVYHC